MTRKERRSTILCYGDSNTHGTRPMRHAGDVTRFSGTVRWPGRLAEVMGREVRVIEAGQPGRTTVHDDPVDGAHKNGLRVLPAILETHRPLDIVVLMLGTNDLKARFSVTSADIARSVERLVEVIGASREGPDQTAPSCLLVAPIPISETGFLGEVFAGGALKSRDLAPRLREVAARTGCGFFDAASCGAVDPADGVHLSAETHRRLGDGIAQAILQWS